jgi:hypothetical protein
VCRQAARGGLFLFHVLLKGREALLFLSDRPSTSFDIGPPLPSRERAKSAWQAHFMISGNQEINLDSKTSRQQESNTSRNQDYKKTRLQENNTTRNQDIHKSRNQYFCIVPRFTNLS